MNAATRYAAATFAGAATVLAFEPAGLYSIALGTFAILIQLWNGTPARQSFWTGFAFGLGLFGVGASWIYISLGQYGGMPSPVAGLATFLFCVLLALFTGGAGWLQSRAASPAWARACVFIPAAWTLGEWLRSWVFTGFPWLSAGYASTAYPMQGYAPLLGVFGVSFVTLSFAGALWLLVQRRHIIFALTVLLALPAAGEALRHVRWSMPSGDPLSVALLQGNIEQELKFRPERYPGIVETYARLAEGTRARLIVLPETALPRFYDSIGPEVLARLQAAATRNGGDMLLGVPYRTSQTAYYNSVLTLGSSTGQAYHKVHLVPFGEFIPPGFNWVMQMLAIPLSDFSRGAPAQPPLRVAGQRIAVNICYEDAFGDEIGRRVPDATLLVNVSNVAWFGDSLAPAQHLQIAQLRAIETGRMHLAASNTGITAAIDRDGRVLARLPQFSEGKLEIAAQGYVGVTPYVRFGDWPVILLSLLVLAVPAFVTRRRMTR